MSWFTDLAGKAEQLLNKVDQTAAVALKKDDVEGLGTPGRYFPSHTQSPLALQRTEERLSNTTSVTQLATPISGSVGVTPHSTPVGRTQSKIPSPQAKPVFKVKSKQQMEDEKLFEFLNSETSPSARQSKPTVHLSESIVVRHSPELEQNSARIESNANVKATVTTEFVEPQQDQLVNKTNDIQEDTSQDVLQQIVNQSSEISVVNNGDTLQQQQQQQQQPSTPAPQSRLSSLEFENRMLKTEIELQKKELSQALQRVKVADTEVQQLKKRLEQCMAQLSAEEKIIRDLQEHDVDIKQTIDAKDSQLAVLRVRLQEADQELAAKRDLLEKLQSENQRILEDHTSSSGLHNQAILSVQERLQQSEELLERERTNFRNAQSENLQRISQLEEQLRTVAANFSELQAKLAEEKSRNNETNSQLKMCKHNVESVQQELTDYKNKAQRILQSKEKLIATLKENSSVTTGSGSETGDAVVSAVELEELRQERDLLKEEVLQANHQATTLRTEMHELEIQLQQEIDIAREQYRDVEESLREERERKKDLEQELSSLKEELKYLREDYTRQKTTLQSRIHERDANIEKLRKQLVAKQVNTTSQVELESRLNALTESLIQKQTMVEALSSEKSSLVFQLERMEKQLKEQSAIGRRTTTLAVNVTDDNDRFMIETPFDGQVARKVKRVYNTIDTLSIRLGVFMRRYPMARILIIAYMVLLHVWVMVVLLTYTPEMHNSENCAPSGK